MTDWSHRTAELPFIVSLSLEMEKLGRTVHLPPLPNIGGAVSVNVHCQ